MALGFNVTILQPLGNVSPLVFLEAAENVVRVLRKNGHDAVFRKNRLVPHMVNIVFGAHLQMPHPVQFPKGTVIFNTEQLGSSSHLVTENYLALLNTHFVWDYSETNLAQIGHDRKALFPFTSTNEGDAPPVAEAVEKPFDLAFCGTINDQRRAILEALKAKGLKVQELYGVFGEERDKLAQMARATLNLHFYETQVFQQIRCFHPLNLGMPVVSDNFPKDSAPGFYQDCILTPGDADFVTYVAELMADAPRFAAESERALQAFYESRNDPQPAEAITKTLEAVAEEVAPRSDQPFDQINIGSGKDYLPGWLNIDVLERVNPDLILDLSADHDWPIKVDSPVFGDMKLEKGSFKKIMANDVLEHVPDLVSFMGACRDLLEEGGVFEILVPYDTGLGAWQDPTHIRGFNENSWLYYTDWAWYLGWEDTRFERTHTQYNLTPHGQKLNGEGKQLEELLVTPRAISHMKVTLTKRAATVNQKMMHLAYSQDWLGHL